jgi:hypothetical protein
LQDIIHVPGFFLHYIINNFNIFFENNLVTQEDNCFVCTKILEKRNIRYILPCLHSLCAKCIEKIVDDKGHCPFCRGKIKKVVPKHTLAYAILPACNLNTVYNISV